MNRFSPEAFIKIMHSLGRFSVVMETEAEDNLLDKNKAWGSLTVDLRRFATEAQALGMKSTKAGADRLANGLEEARTRLTPLARGHLVENAAYLRTVAFDEVHDRLFMQITQAEQSLLFGDNLFGDQVATAFPSAAWDIEETARCLAYSRSTAVVFHLGRVAEIATIQVGRKVGYASKREGFGEVLNYLDNGLRKAREDYSAADPRFKGDIEFLGTVAAQMHAVNPAWRQRVSHLDKKYTPEEAQRVWDTTKGLMQHLATKMKEEPSPAA